MTGPRVPGGRVAGLDLLRGTAIALVLLRHALPGLFPGAGVVGVVMFFAISGHLITGVLLDELGRTGRIDLLRFYRRRARRLLPALVALVAGVVAVTLALDPLDDRDRLPMTVVRALTFTGDLPVGHSSAATFHLWTLGVEEQFYLLWPAFLLVVVSRNRLRWGLVVAAGACVVGAVLTVIWLREDPDLGYALPTSWAVCFVVGAASRAVDLRPAPPCVTAAAATALGVLSMVPLRGHAWTYLVAAPAVAALTGLLLLTCRQWRRLPWSALRPLAALGVVSYGVYLWDYPLTVWLRPHVAHAGLLAAIGGVVLGALSWHTVERVRCSRSPAPVSR